MTSSDDQFRVLALVGVYAADFDNPTHRDTVRPIVAGVIPEEVWNHQTQQEIDRTWNELRETIDPSGMDYLWREAWLTLDAAAMRPLFAQPAAPTEYVNTSPDLFSLLVLAGVHIGDYDHPDHQDTFIPVIAGCVDEAVWGMEAEEDTAARWETCKPSYDVSGTDYLWREIWITLPAGLLRGLFDQPTITATVQPSASQDPTNG